MVEFVLRLFILFYREPVSYIRELYKINKREYRAIENFKPAFAREIVTSPYLD